MTNPTPTQPETLEPCPLSHYIHTGLRAYKTGPDPRIVCFDCGLTLRAPDWIKVYERWQSRARAADAGPRATYESAHPARYSMTHAVHPDIVVLWFLALKSHWFDDPGNMFFGMREQAKAYLYKWVETGELAEDHTTLEIATAMKFREWLASSWTAATASPTPAESVDKERQRCAAIARAWLWGSITDPGVLESVGRYAAQRCQGILHAILSGADASHLAGAEGRDGPVPPERTREIFDAGFAATSPAERSTWNEVLSEFADTAIKCHIGFKHDGPWDECKWVECEDRRKLIQRANAAAPADNDAREVCRLLSTLDWVVGYELVTENQLILDRAQELALKVMGMTNPPTPTKGDR